MYLGRVCAASGNAFGNIQLNKLTLYNNGTGFMFSGNGNVYSSAHISNIRSFNNISDGVFFQQISGVMLSNIVTFNNGGH